MGLRSERVSEVDPCSISRRWLLEPDLAQIIVDVESVAERTMAAQGIRWPGLFIISGYRSRVQQEEANPLQPFSLHRRCPSLAVDLRVGDVPATVTPFETWNFIGQIFKNFGARWGGDFTSTEPDLNHFYLAGTPAQ